MILCIPFVCTNSPKLLTSDSSDSFQRREEAIENIWVHQKELEK